MILRFITAALCASLLVSACYTPIEGCLDTEATNFDASADKDCCCKYPLLVLNVENAYDTLIWKPDTAYQNDLGQWFRIRDIVFYVSELKLTQNGVSGVVEDTITLSRFASPTSNDTIKSLYTDDFLLIRRVPTTQYTVGTFRPSGTFENATLRFGLSDEAQLVVPGKAPGGHPLANQNENLWRGRDTAYAYARVVFARDTAASAVVDTVLLTRFDAGNFFISQQGAFYHEPGFDFRLVLRADWKNLFNGVDLPNDDKTTVVSKMAGNLPAVFSIKQ
jgi:hypothetical protein